MDEQTKRLLYTTKDGRWYWETDYAADQLELDDEDIDFDRIPHIRELLVPGAINEELRVPLEAALVLSAWGDEVGLHYLEYIAGLSDTERYGAGYSHRLGNFDTTFEWITRAAMACDSINFDRKGDEIMRSRVFPIIANALKCCETGQFEFPAFQWIKRNRYHEYDDSLRSYLCAMLRDGSGFHHHKPADAVKFFVEYDPVYLDAALSEVGKTRADYPSV
jgi:hypothetical protein